MAPSSLSLLLSGVFYTITHCVVPAPPGAPKPHWVGGGTYDNYERLQASHHAEPDYVPFVIGPYGQDCTPDTGDFPDACPTVGYIARSSVDGEIACKHNFDCCTCGKMICAPDCVGVIANGDSGAYGAKGIEIAGGMTPDGASINCNGDLSCMESRMVGTDIGSVLCTGDGACAYSYFDLTCVESGCAMRCVGDHACEAHPTDASLDATYIIRNAAGLYCASHACRWATMNLLGNTGGDVICGAERACEGLKVTIDNILSIMCGGVYACKGATFLVVNPENGFQIYCQAMGSCQDMTIEIVVTKPEITELMGFVCGGPHSCERATATITHHIIAVDLSIGELVCGAAKSCSKASFDLGPNVFFLTCSCAGGLTGACDNLVGVDCNQGAEMIKCTATAPCAGKQEFITNPVDGFQLICADKGACENYVLTINIDRAPYAPQSLFGVSCNADGACKGLRLFILNTGHHAVDAGQLACTQNNACEHAAVLMQGASFTEVSCVKGTSCDACAIFTDNQYTPCGSF
eukprot:CAMPEP_0197023356 /NCGR_PEP_ID=MMETSP1384-20130603/4057_1 /TAXON_ID=29189 /ORGANISM="Ammonia sp." /LENGTH=520 /DNA_ID=CAMNT_0042451553 /DNA_START=24 /DNA_END=1586 /DNA_ORIENTATION=+